MGNAACGGCQILRDELHLIADQRDDLREAACEMIAAWMSGSSERQAAAIIQLEDLTGGQQNGS